MDRGEIWLVSLEPVKGREQKGTRPVMVVTPKAFNTLTQAPLVVPITSGGDFARMKGFAVSLSGAGTETTGIVRCDQPRVLDLQSRGGKRLERLPDYIIDDVLAKLATLIE